MKRVLVAAGAVALLLLTGCSGGGDQVNVAVNSATPAPAASAESAAPLTAETPSADASEARATPEGAFLVKVREVLPDDTAIPDATDAQLLAAAQDACAQMATGLDSTMVSVIEGEQKDGLGVYQDSARVAAVARQTLCP